MAVLDHHSHIGGQSETNETNRCAIQFALTWVGFLVLVVGLSFLTDLF